MTTKKKIIFVSEMYLSLEHRSSTHIMIDTIIDGFLDADYEMLFVVISAQNEMSAIEKKYKKRGIQLIFWESLIPREIINKYLYLLKIYSSIIKGISVPRTLMEELKHFRDEKTVLVSHLPTVESAYMCKQIKKELDIRYVQYWSDPISLGGILPEQFSYKRYPFWVVENRALSFADEVVYGTKSLMTHQKELFKKHSAKMRYVRVAYTKKTTKICQPQTDKISVLYSGNYYSTIRNIMPLYEAMRKAPPNFQLSIYGKGDCVLQNTYNVEVCERIEYERMQEVEAQADIQICILNQNCIQIPGKVFYNTDLDQRILVLLDGKYKESIRQELEEYQRFEFCENNADAIADYFRRYDEENNNIFKKQCSEMISPKKVSETIVARRN